MTIQNLTMTRGDTFPFDVTVTVAGVPLDISLYDIWCTAKYHLEDSDNAAVFQLTKTGGAITVTGANNNIARVVIPASATSALTSNVSLLYDVQIQAPGGTGQVTTVVSGALLIVRDVTQTIH